MVGRLAQIDQPPSLAWETCVVPDTPMNELDVFMLHRIVGGLAPGALPHEEAVWCVTL